MSDSHRDKAPSDSAHPPKPRSGRGRPQKARSDQGRPGPRETPKTEPRKGPRKPAPRPPEPTDPRFTPLETVSAIFEQVLDASTADETELVWFERRYGLASYPPRPDDFLEDPRLSVLVRVVEGRRQGWYRTETPDASMLESGLRQALALATVQPRVRRRPVLPKPTEIDTSLELVDHRLGDLDKLDAAQKLVASWCQETAGPENGLRARMHGSMLRMAVFNNHGVRCRSAATEVSLEVTAGEGPGAGRAAGSARSFAALGHEGLIRLALDRRHDGEIGPAPEGPIPILLSAEATVELLNLLNTWAFASRSYREGMSFLAKHRNVQVFDRAFNLRDDALRMPGMPFPFDFEGSPKRPLDLIVEGQPSTPALNRWEAAEAGLEPTAQAVGGQDSMFGNLYFEPGDAAEESLLRAADGGLMVGWLDAPECFDPTQLRFRAVARGVRRIEGGKIGAPVEDLVWEDSLLRAFARLAAVGNDPIVRARPSTPLGAISAPSLVLVESDGFQPAKARG